MGCSWFGEDMIGDKGLEGDEEENADGIQLVYARSE